MKRRTAILLGLSGLAANAALFARDNSLNDNRNADPLIPSEPVNARQQTTNAPRQVMLDSSQLDANPASIEPFELTDAQWRDKLSAEAYSVLRKEGTERPFTSVLYDESRPGQYVCAGCGLALFEQDTKFDSGTGWPSFFDTIEGRVETRVDNKFFMSRTEYHCIRCGGHQGHVFKDGPRPTGLRYCNNGVALNFVPASEA